MAVAQAGFIDDLFGCKAARTDRLACFDKVAAGVPPGTKLTDALIGCRNKLISREECYVSLFSSDATLVANESDYVFWRKVSAVDPRTKATSTEYVSKAKTMAPKRHGPGELHLGCHEGKAQAYVSFSEIATRQTQSWSWASVGKVLGQGAARPSDDGKASVLAEQDENRAFLKVLSEKSDLRLKIDLGGVGADRFYWIETRDAPQAVAQLEAECRSAH